jgi:hypothetical protein
MINKIFELMKMLPAISYLSLKDITSESIIETTRYQVINFSFFAKGYLIMRIRSKHKQVLRAQAM